MQSNNVLLILGVGIYISFSFILNVQYAAYLCVGPDSSLKVSNELVASIKSIAAFLQHRMEAEGPNTGCPAQSDRNSKQAKQSKVCKQLFITLPV